MSNVYLADGAAYDKRVEQLFHEVCAGTYDKTFNERFWIVGEEYIVAGFPRFDFKKVMDDPNRYGSIAALFVLMQIDYSVVTPRSPDWPGDPDYLQDCIVATYIHYNDDEDTCTQYGMGRNLNQALLNVLLQVMRERIESTYTQTELKLH